MKIRIELLKITKAWEVEAASPKEAHAILMKLANEAYNYSEDINVLKDSDYMKHYPCGADAAADTREYLVSCMRFKDKVEPKQLDVNDWNSLL